MPDISYRDEIVKNIAAALRLITVANGYNSDVGEVNESEFHSIGTIPEDKYPALNVVDTTESAEIQDIGSQEKTLTVIVVGFVKGPEDKLTKLRKLMADIEKAALIDPRRGSNAQWTKITKIVTDEGMLGDYGEVDVHFTVKYQHVIGDANSQG